MRCVWFRRGFEVGYGCSILGRVWLFLVFLGERNGHFGIRSGEEVEGILEADEKEYMGGNSLKSVHTCLMSMFV